MAIARSLRSTGITPLHHYKETDSPPQLDSDDAAMAYERFIRCGSAKAGGELLRSSPPLSGASVLSASRLEPLVPCMGLCLSRSFGTPAYLYPSSVSLFDPKAVSSSRPALRPCRRAQKLSKVGRRTNLVPRSALARPYLDSFEHDGTLAAVGMTIRGELAFGRGSIAPQPCIRWARGPEP